MLGKALWAIDNELDSRDFERLSTRDRGTHTLFRRGIVVGPAHILPPELGLRASPRILRGSGRGFRSHRPFAVSRAEHPRYFAAGRRGAGQAAGGEVHMLVRSRDTYLISTRNRCGSGSHLAS